VVARGRWSSLMRPLVCGRTGLVAFHRLPRGPAECGPSARDGSSAPWERKTREQGSPVWSTGDQVHLVRERSCRTAGCERGRMPLQVTTRLQEATDRSTANTGGRCQRKWHRPQCVCRQRGCACGSERLQGSRASLNSNCQKNRRKLFSSPTTPHIACDVVVNAFQQYERLARLATAKLERRRPILRLAHPPLRETSRIHWRFTIGAC
jgi:hypothetical protein